MSIIIILLITLLPSIVIGVYVYQKDKYEKEPLKLIIYSLLFGCLAIIPSLILETVGGFLENINLFLYTLIGVASVEEGVKFFFLKKYLYPNKEFNEPFDGIIYSVMISLGFATIENLTYVFLYSETSESLYVAFTRMFSAVPLHASCGVIMGYYVGKAKFQKEKSILFLILGLTGAITLHTFYDYFLFLGEGQVFSFVYLSIGIYYSFKAMKKHQENSPFKN
jgi:RsiW-degrading membrane proteinase PrsW (M82 family)